MSRRLSRAPWLVLAVGVMLGITINSQFNRSHVQLPPESLNATATHGGDTMAIATGVIEEECEGLFLLDYATGKLTCRTVNPRNGAIEPREFVADVAEELVVEQVKQPKYLMVTGAAKFQAKGGEVRPAKSVVYVAEANTGNWVAYWLPWQERPAISFGLAGPIEMQVLGKGSIRDAQRE